ncbi:MAG: hypothetical protein KGH78_05365, partial [Candidatus Micrarchaeota archaeon]|nr:hypothetical protein [Candidatus Micrarchaeota archaeon]
MYIETRIVGNKKKYYLTHTYRLLDQVKKARVYLGTNLPKEVLSQKIKDAEAVLEAKLTQAKTLKDPYKTTLSALELEE